MAKRFLYHDPVTNIVHWHDYDNITGKAYHIQEGDSQVNVDHSTTLRNDEDYKKKSIKHGGMHAVHWPPMVMAEMLTRFNCDVTLDPKRAIAIALEHFPSCLTVPKKSLQGFARYYNRPKIRD